MTRRLDVREGEIVALLGRNGAGKSTLLKTLAGLVPLASGKIEYEGRDIAGLSAPDIARMGIGYVPQGRGLFAGMTVRENLSLGRLARSTDGSHGAAWSEEQILEYFPRLKARMDVAADYLSGGEQQMVAVARAMSGNVRLLLLDEPFEGLAPAVILELFERIRPIAAAYLDRDRRAQSRSGTGVGQPCLCAGAWRGVSSGSGGCAALNDLDYRKQILWL